MEGTIVDDKKIILPHEDKLEITMRITAMLLSDLSKSKKDYQRTKALC